MTAKRLFDLLLSLTALFLLFPLFVVIAILIKSDTPGPVFFRQSRVGRYGRVFRIHKFRTMLNSPIPDGHQITIGQDPRITFVGKWLRQTKLDEIAQLLDVVAGDMSLVGPRPEVPQYVALYPSDLRDVVLSVRPGITDYASIFYKDESRILSRSLDPIKVYKEEIMPVKLSYAVDYVRTRSLWGDIICILNTLAALLRLPGFPPS